MLHSKTLYYVSLASVKLTQAGLNHILQAAINNPHDVPVSHVPAICMRVHVCFSRVKSIRELILFVRQYWVRMNAFFADHYSVYVRFVNLRRHSLHPSPQLFEIFWKRCHVRKVFGCFCVWLWAYFWNPCSAANDTYFICYLSLSSVFVTFKLVLYLDKLEEQVKSSAAARAFCLFAGWVVSTQIVLCADNKTRCMHP